MATPNWSSFSPMLGEVALLDVDTGGPGAFALAGLSTSAHYGRASYYADIIEGWDPILGAGEFIFAQASLSVAPGQVVQFGCSQDSTNVMQLTATPWTGTANAGQELGIAISSVGTGQWGWFQVSGFAVCNHGGTTAGQTVNSATISGNVATITTASGHTLVVGQTVNLTGFTPTQFNGSYLVASVVSTTVFTVNLPVTNIPANNATVNGTYTFYAGAVTGQTISGITVSSLVATATTSSAHGLQVGDTVVVAAATGNTAVNGTFVVASVPSTTTFTYAVTANGAVTGSPTYTVTGPAVNGQAYFSANGAASGVIVASKHVLGAQWGTSTAAKLGTGTGATTLPAWQAVLYLGRPNSQGAIT